jgi:hypothetical protein
MEDVTKTIKFFYHPDRDSADETYEIDMEALMDLIEEDPEQDLAVIVCGLLDAPNQNALMCLATLGAGQLFHARL